MPKLPHPLLLFLGLLLAGSFQAAPLRHAEPDLPFGWVLLPPPSGAITFRLILRQPGVQQLIDLASRVSNPSSPEYGNHLSKSEIEILTAPSETDEATVRTWALSVLGCGVTDVEREVAHISCSAVERAEQLLQTRFHSVRNLATGQAVPHRAASFSLPAQVAEATAAIYGLHGLPVPLSTALSSPALSLRRVNSTIQQSKPINVTPSVLTGLYGVFGVTPNRSSTRNRQAVVEFQGQTMNETDLATFFTKFVPAGVKSKGDDTVFRFVGGHGGAGPAGVEASLDVQYIMGVAPGVKTEFWYIEEPGDFCGALKRWTTQLLSTENPPLVHSMSYGYQGALDKLGCPHANAMDINTDLAKLAARGLSVIVSSGDAGSGFQQDAPSRSVCGNSSTFEPGWELEGQTLQVGLQASDAESCCGLASEAALTFGPPVEGFTFTPTSGMPYCRNARLPGTLFQGLVLDNFQTGGADDCCSLTEELCHTAQTCAAGWTFLPDAGFNGNCTLWATVTGRSGGKGSGVISSDVHASNISSSGGNCSVFRTVRGRKPSVPNATHNASVAGLLPVPQTGSLWPSFPASSAFVTSVGSTRFINHSASDGQMAADEFGVGGGFSSLFPAFTAQEDGVTSFLQKAASSGLLPPAGVRFARGGRATPDVSVLGEAFLVVVKGSTWHVSGTSASAPSFAGMVSLLNEARLAVGKKPMGLLNPWLYQNSQALQNVSVGTDKIGSNGPGPPYPLPYGFYCAAGWNPVTGLGTPKFQALLKAAITSGK